MHHSICYFSRSQSCNFQRQQFRLEVETVGSKRDASGLLALRKKSNLTLASVLTAFVVLHLRRLVGAVGATSRQSINADYA